MTGSGAARSAMPRWRFGGCRWWVAAALEHTLYQPPERQVLVLWLNGGWRAPDDFIQRNQRHIATAGIRHEQQFPFSINSKAIRGVAHARKRAEQRAGVQVNG